MNTIFLQVSLLSYHSSGQLLTGQVVSRVPRLLVFSSDALSIHKFIQLLYEFKKTLSAPTQRTSVLIICVLCLDE